ncbi:hypothetical protein C9J85_00905 [Haloferax sp. wsp5]|nr:hypothetical protein C9J85_00905 [Haloferax sp. wsp5]
MRHLDLPAWLRVAAGPFSIVQRSSPSLGEVGRANRVFVGIASPTSVSGALHPQAWGSASDLIGETVRWRPCRSHIFITILSVGRELVVAESSD